MSIDATSAAVHRRLRQHLFLIGFMGGGKPTAASTLSAALGLPTLDSDACLEQELGCSIADFFSHGSEQAFRGREIEFLRNLRGQSPCLISRGGGMALRSESRTLMRLLGPVIHLTTTPGTVFSHVGTDTARPLLKDEKTPADTATTIQVRLPLYGDAASLRIAADHLSPAGITDELIRLLQPFLSGDESCRS